MKTQFKTGSKIAALGIALYVAAYFLFMARNVPALDQRGKVAFNSSFRLARVAGRMGPLSIETSQVTIWNYLFLPVDTIYYAIRRPAVF
jgi:hypothetical protein